MAMRALKKGNTRKPRDFAVRFKRVAALMLPVS
jgi:hypothetical protein